jgi:hypothetical protein
MPAGRQRQQAQPLGGDLPEATRRRTSALGASAVSSSQQEEPEPMIKDNISEKNGP